MGLQNNQSKTYAHIYKGKITLEVPEGTEGAVTRVNKNGREVSEVFFDSYEGTLIDITTGNGNYGKYWLFTFEDQGEEFTLQSSYSDSYAKALLKSLPNIDVKKPFKITPEMKTENGDTKTALYINQNGEGVKWAYTKENPNGLPQWEKITVKGEEKWDDTKELLFLEEMVQKEIIPNLPERKVPKNDQSLAVNDDSLDAEFSDDDF